MTSEGTTVKEAVNMNSCPWKMQDTFDLVNALCKSHLYITLLCFKADCTEGGHAIKPYMINIVIVIYFYVKCEFFLRVSSGDFCDALCPIPQYVHNRWINSSLVRKNKCILTLIGCVSEKMITAKKTLTLTRKGRKFASKWHRGLWSLVCGFICLRIFYISP